MAGGATREKIPACAREAFTEIVQFVDIVLTTAPNPGGIFLSLVQGGRRVGWSRYKNHSTPLAGAHPPTLGIARIGDSRRTVFKALSSAQQNTEAQPIWLSFLFCKNLALASVGQQDAQVADIISRRASDNGVVDCLKQWEAVELSCSARRAVATSFGAL